MKRRREKILKWHNSVLFGGDSQQNDEPSGCEDANELGGSSPQDDCIHRRKKRRLEDLPKIGKYADGTPFRLGAELIMNAQWVGLSEQIRSKDKGQHLANLKTMSAAEPMPYVNFKKGYKIFSAKRDLADKSEGWHKAPVLVTTNLERHLLMEPMARRFARIEEKHVYRWQVQHRGWKQAPNEILWESDAIERNACFWEYFVEGAECYFTDNVNKDHRQANGTRAEFHSLIARDKEQEAEILRLQETTPIGGVITLSYPPAWVNVRLLDETKDKKQWKHLTLVDGDVVVPIPPKRKGRNLWKRTIVMGKGDSYDDSIVNIKQNFPLEPAFTTTVHKAQGRTMAKVILALSFRESKLCQLKYEGLYVAMSRVTSKEDMRLLVHDKDWSTCHYISQLRPHPSAKAFIAGFQNSGGTSWDVEEAYKCWAESKQ